MLDPFTGTQAVGLVALLSRRLRHAFYGQANDEASISASRNPTCDVEKLE